MNMTTVNEYEMNNMREVLGGNVPSNTSTMSYEYEKFFTIFSIWHGVYVRN